MILIPTDSETPLYDLRVTIDDSDYVLSFDYSQREDRWYLSLALPSGDVLVRGWKLVTGVMLGIRVADRRMPAGAFAVITQAQDQSPPGWGELGADRRCQLYYVTRGEIDAG
jgi:hypothetical protein